MNIDFRGQTVLLTGATRGIGKQLADDLMSLGADLILTGTDKHQVEVLNQEAICNNEGSKKYHAVDFSNAESMNYFTELIESYGKIDVCINNAGINRINFLDETSDEDWKDLLMVNLEAPFKITRAVSRVMKRNGYGRIVNVASIFGTITKEKRSIYTTTKFGLRGLTMTASIELAPHNILVNAVSPGFTLTELTKSILSAEEITQLSAQVPMGRFAHPTEISRVILFLASPLNTYLTGQNIVVDGGFVNV